MKIKTVLVANNHLKRVGGSETFTYTLIEALLKKGYEVEYFTFFKGEVSQRIERDLDVQFMSKSKYDLILANHNTCVNYLSKRGVIIQTCHGIFPKEEQPTQYADGHVGISKEVKDHVKTLGFDSEIIVNGINCERYYVKKPINTELKNVLSLSQSEPANAKILAACEALGLRFSKFNKNENSVWHVEDMINEADLVLGLGRSAYEAMACGRTVVVFDERAYFQSYSDGYMTPDLVKQCVENNCSGRYSKLEFTTEDLIDAFKKYKKEDGNALRELALTDFNIDIQVDRYLKYASTLTKKNSGLKLLFASWYQNHRMQKRIRKANKKD
ncbi:MAG: UDP-glycosyltransferase [Lacinutrix sp.]|uniref:glycosyltransferase n=1 Tax=Lacinutrix sp. TaxID=1937692 RepID=UPI0030B11FB2